MSECYRPRYHYSARAMWLNDPNGLIHHGGLWHLYYQANPHADTWGNMSWGHATSPDLVSWTEHPVALAFAADEQVFSGSVVCDHEGRSPFGAGALVAFYTSHYEPSSPRHGTQAQSIATSTDGGYTWARYAGNPVVDRGSSDFRDPKVFRYRDADFDGWVMVCVEAVERRVVLYRSPDLVSWEYLSTWTAADAPVLVPDDGPATCWECPDLFSLTLDGETHWVLLVDINPGGVHGGSASLAYVGSFDGRQFVEHERPVARSLREQPWLDWGRDHYAAVTFADAPEGRRVAVAWMSNWDYAREVPTRGWRSAMSTPRELSLERRGGQVVVVQRPVPELAAALPAPTTHPDVVAAPRATLPVPREATLLELVMHPDADDVYLDLDGARLGYRRGEDGQGELYLDRTDSGEVDFHVSFASEERAPVPLADGALALTIVRDACSLEVFADGGAVTMTELVFPTGERGPIGVVADGGSVRVSCLRWA